MSNGYGSANAFDGLGKGIWMGVDAGARCITDVVKYFADKYGDNKRDKAKELFRNVGMVRKDGETGKINQPVIMKQIKTDYGVHMIVKPYPGIWIGDFFKYHAQLESALNAEVQITQDNKGYIHLRAFTRGIPRRFKYVDSLASRAKKYPCAVPVGIGREGLVMLNLSDDECFSVLIAGMPGGGKSSFIRQALMSLVVNYTPDEVILYLVDMKQGGVELSGFQLAPHVKDFACNLAGAKRVLTAAFAELDYRAKLISKANVSSIADYNKVSKEKMSHAVIVIDEWMSLDEDAKKLALTLVQQGRFAGIHTIICTQHPSCKVVSGEVRSLIPATIAFKVSSRRYSRMVLGEERNQAAYLECPGRCIFQAKERMRKVQVMDLHPGMIKGMIKEVYPSDKVVTVLATEEDKVLSW